MKKNIFENLIKLFNGTNTEKIANINIHDTNISEDSFSDDSYIEDVLNSEESIRLGSCANGGNQICKDQINWD